MTRAAAPCWSCLNPGAPLIAHPGQCDACAQPAALLEPAATDDTCMRCGREAAAPLCDACCAAPDVWALAEAFNA